MSKSHHAVIQHFVDMINTQDTFLGIPATGRPVNFQSIDIWRVEDGLLAEHWDQLDLNDIFRQLGVDPATVGQS